MVIPCLNAEATLAVQLEALASQKWSRPWEVVLADNGSTDQSLLITRKYAERISNLRIIDASGRRGPSRPRNLGVKAAASDRVVFCDADDEVAPGWVAAMGEALSKNDLVCGDTRFDKFNPLEMAEAYARLWRGGLYREQFMPHASTCNMGIRRAAHEAIGGFDEALPRYQDGDYCWRLQFAGYQFTYVPEAVVQYRIDRASHSFGYHYRRSRTSAAAEYWLYKRYRPLGMGFSPYSNMKQSFLSFLHVVRKMPDALARHELTIWMEQFAMCTGDVVGQFQGRLTNPVSHIPSPKQDTGHP